MPNILTYGFDLMQRMGIAGTKMAQYHLTRRSVSLIQGRGFQYGDSKISMFHNDEEACVALTPGLVNGVLYTDCVDRTLNLINVPGLSPADNIRNGVASLLTEYVSICE